MHFWVPLFAGLHQMLPSEVLCKGIAARMPPPSNAAASCLLAGCIGPGQSRGKLLHESASQTGAPYLTPSDVLCNDTGERHDLEGSF